MGIVLMIVGVLCFIVGFVLYSSPNKTVEPLKQSPVNADKITSSTSKETPDSLSKSSDTTYRSDSSNELEKIISMAVIDGVLTPNERNLIKDFAYSRGLNYNVIIRDVEKRITSAGTAETEMIDINKKNGNDFEKFVVQKFNRKFFKVKEWAGDKYVKGVYAQTTQHPDLLLELKLKNQTSEFSVECKWRRDLYNNGIEFATPEQLKRYREFEENKNIPVFIAIGVGGKGESPNQLFIIPLKDIKSNFIPATVLNRYKKDVEKNFFFDTETQSLK